MSDRVCALPEANAPQYIAHKEWVLTFSRPPFISGVSNAAQYREVPTEIKRCNSEGSGEVHGVRCIRQEFSVPWYLHTQICSLCSR